MSFESHITLGAAIRAKSAAKFAELHPFFLGRAITYNEIAQGAAARLTQEQPESSDIPQILRTIVEVEKSVSRSLAFNAMAFAN